MLIFINEGNHANDVPLSKVKLPTYVQDFSEFLKPQPGPGDSNFFLTFSEPLFKAPYHEHKPFKDWIFKVQKKL